MNVIKTSYADAYKRVYDAEAMHAQPDGTPTDIAAGRTVLFCSSMTLPDGDEIDLTAFEHQGTPDTIEIPDGTTEILPFEFAGCPDLKHVKIPDSVVKIGFGAFARSGLESVEIPAGVRYIDESVFDGCTDLKIASIRGSSDMHYVSKGMFNNCRALEHVDMSDNINELDGSAFSNCASLKNIDIPSGVHTIGDCAFYGCEGIENIDLPESLRYVEDGAFAYCALLKGMNFPGGVKYIGENAFYGCSSLEHVAFLGCRLGIGEYTFYDCPALDSESMRAIHAKTYIGRPDDDPYAGLDAADAEQAALRHASTSITGDDIDDDWMPEYSKGTTVDIALGDESSDEPHEAARAAYAALREAAMNITAEDIEDGYCRDYD